MKELFTEHKDWIPFWLHHNRAKWNSLGLVDKISLSKYVYPYLNFDGSICIRSIGVNTKFPLQKLTGEKFELEKWYGKIYLRYTGPMFSDHKLSHRRWKMRHSILEHFKMTAFCLNKEILVTGYDDPCKHWMMLNGKPRNVSDYHLKWYRWICSVGYVYP